MLGRSDRHNMHIADVVIVGGGIVGSSIAYHLTESGCRKILVIERESAQGKGSTGKSMGGVRAQFSTPVSIQMSLYSIPFYANFEEHLGYPCDYRPQGYLFCATTAQQMAYLRTNYAQQLKMGLKNVRLMQGDEIGSMFPQLRADDIVGGSFCSTDGFVDPYSAMTGIHDLRSRPWRNIVEEHSRNRFYARRKRDCICRDYARPRGRSQGSKLRRRLGCGRGTARRRGSACRAVAPHARPQ